MQQADRRLPITARSRFTTGLKQAWKIGTEGP